MNQLKSVFAQNQSEWLRYFHEEYDHSALEYQHHSNILSEVFLIPWSDTRSASIIQANVHTQQINFRVLL